MTRTQPSPTSGSSAFSFSSFWASFSKSPSKTTLTADTEISSIPSLPSRNGLDCKLIWGISGKSFKPGLLFTSPTKPTTGQLLLLQMGKSFKTQCIDEPGEIIETLIRNFSFARSVIPSISRFAACLTDENYDRLNELRIDAILWKQCGKMDSTILAKGPVLQDISGEALEKLLYQPNIFHILGEATMIFSCIELGIPSPSTSTRTPSVDGSVSLSLTNSPLTMTSEEDNWLYLEKHTYHGTLQSSLDDLLPHDPVLSLPIETLYSLIDGMTEVQLLLNVWFAPYQRNGEVDDIATESIATALTQLDKTNAKSAKEGEELIHAGGIASGNWIRDAATLRGIEHDFNVWNLALQRCLKIKSSYVF